jgi:CubicO group peptidase (beta-lactamase class C family)
MNSDQGFAVPNSAIAFALLLFVAGHQSARTAELDPQKLSAIVPRMQQFVEEGTVAGVVTVVGNSKGIVHHEAVGFQNLEDKRPMPKDAMFRIASMTKPITAIGILQLQEAGKLSVEDEVAKHLPEFREQMARRSRQ